MKKATAKTKKSAAKEFSALLENGISIIQFQDPSVCEIDMPTEMVWVEGDDNMELGRKWDEVSSSYSECEYGCFTDFVEEFMDSTGRKWGFLCYDVCLTI